MTHNAWEVLEKVCEKINHAEAFKHLHGWSMKYRISDVYEELAIFDWWNETLSVSQLKQMKRFLEQARDRGFNGYVCFRVGAKGCSHGMWAFKQESTTGHSPDGDCLFHSFRSGDNYWDARLNGEWMSRKYNKCEFTIKEIDEEIKKEG